MSRSPPRSAAALLALGLVGCSWGTVPKEDFARRYPFASPVLQPATLAEALADLTGEIGSASPRVVTVSLWDDFVRIEAQDPKNPGHFDDYVWHDGSLPKPSPESLRGDELTRLQGQLFNLAEAPLSDPRPLVKAAFAAAKVEDGAVTGFDVRRTSAGRGAPGPVIVHVSVKGPRGSAYVDLDTSGKVLKVSS